MLSQIICIGGDILFTTATEKEGIGFYLWGAQVRKITGNEKYKTEEQTQKV